MQLGLDDFDRGDYEVYDDDTLKEFFEQIKIEGRKELDRESGGRSARPYRSAAGMMANHTEDDDAVLEKIYRDRKCDSRGDIER